MRTTVTLDSDVEKLLRDAMKRGEKSFKEVLNEAVRMALRGRGGEPEPEFELRARPLRLRSGIDPALLRDLDDEIEIEEFVRKSRAAEAADR